jgi:hypothetical protein
MLEAFGGIRYKSTELPPLEHLDHVFHGRGLGIV